MKQCKIKAPFFEIGPKSYLYGDEILALAQAADAASEKYGVDLPICETVYKVLYCNEDAAILIRGLFNRSLKQEF